MVTYQIRVLKSLLLNSHDFIQPVLWYELWYELIFYDNKLMNHPTPPTPNKKIKQTNPNQSNQNQTKPNQTNQINPSNQNPITNPSKPNPSQPKKSKPSQKTNKSNHARRSAPRPNSFLAHSLHIQIINPLSSHSPSILTFRSPLSFSCSPNFSSLAYYSTQYPGHASVFTSQPLLPQFITNTSSSSILIVVLPQSALSVHGIPTLLRADWQIICLVLSSICCPDFLPKVVSCMAKNTATATNTANTISISAEICPLNFIISSSFLIIILFSYLLSWPYLNKGFSRFLETVRTASFSDKKLDIRRFLPDFNEFAGEKRDVEFFTELLKKHLFYKMPGKLLGYTLPTF